MLKDETADLAEVAAALGRSPSWLRRNWLRYHLEQGFPRKIPGAGLVWPRRAVAAFLAAGGAAEPAPEAVNDNAGGDLVAAAAKALRQRYGVSP